MAIIYYFIFVFIFMTSGIAILEFFFWSIEKSFNYLKEYFFPTPELPDEILDAIEQEAHDFIWSMHRSEEPDMVDYQEATKFLYKQKYAEYFGQ